MAKRNGKAPELTPSTATVADLRPHPRNYRQHPDDQLEHLARSIEEHGLYRNVVVAQDGTILAGHGVVLAAQRLGLKTIPVIRLPIEPDSPAALKVLTGDNEIEHLAEQDDRLLSELLREIKQEAEAGLLGTGYDEAMLANLALVTRPAAEIQNFDAAAQWAGMPSYEREPDPLELTVRFRSIDDRAEFARRLDLSIHDGTKATWFPARVPEDVSSVRIEA